MLKLIELRDTFGALLDWITVVRILVFCSADRFAEAPALLLVSEAVVFDLTPAPDLVSVDDRLAGADSLALDVGDFSSALDRAGQDLCSV
jgi:hypothetical protein